MLDLEGATNVFKFHACGGASWFFSLLSHLNNNNTTTTATAMTGTTTTVATTAGNYAGGGINSHIKGEMELAGSVSSKRKYAMAYKGTGSDTEDDAIAKIAATTATKEQLQGVLADQVINRGKSVHDVSDSLGISSSYAYELLNEFQGYRPCGPLKKLRRIKATLDTEQAAFLRDQIDTDRTHTIVTLKEKLLSRFPQLHPMSMKKLQDYMADNLTFTVERLVDEEEDRGGDEKEVDDFDDVGLSSLSSSVMSSIDHHSQEINDSIDDYVFIGNATYILYKVACKNTPHLGNRRPGYCVPKKQWKRVFTMYAAISTTGGVDAFEATMGPSSINPLVKLVDHVTKTKSPFTKIIVSSDLAQEQELLEKLPGASSTPVFTSHAVNESRVPSSSSLLLSTECSNPLDKFFTEFCKYLDRGPLGKLETFTERMEKAAQCIPKNICQSCLRSISTPINNEAKLSGGSDEYRFDGSIR
ncbi:hypothetical protein BDB00DRAFT_826728 [Zychaea mexicana]|uniref:uncharacterized protein n=1 Tax=Zychaea mexicana TaxID=64656 RepID=UPI0022FECF56|nr:uncharacterized protein BDB00DRAFT_826728 [Zychaea mexicana]KAI9492676.1 hypothetical protein BDB00DRAFT_826728 [Zychaea mexicana]